MELYEAAKGFQRGYFSTHNRSERTKKAYAIDLEQFLEYIGEAEEVESLLPDDLEQWAAELKAREYAPASIRRKFATLRVFFSYWVRKGVLDRSPLWQIRLDLAPPRKLTRTLSAEEMQDLLKAAHRAAHWPNGIGSGPMEPADKDFLGLRNLTIVEVLFATGIRVGELVALRVGDYRASESVFTIEGKGARQRLAFLPDERSRGVFEAYLGIRRAMVTSHEKLLVNSWGTALTTQGVAGVVRKLAEEAGIDRRVTPHMLRHTVATLLLRNGADLRVVQEFLGHASISTTERYTAVSKEHLTASLREFHPNKLVSIFRT